MEGFWVLLLLAGLGRLLVWVVFLNASSKEQGLHPNYRETAKIAANRVR